MERVKVVASKIDEKHIYYECPYCYTIQGGRVVKTCFKGNGGFYKSAKSTIHKHGSGGNLENRVEYRQVDNCLVNKGEIEIHITDDTKKPVLPVLMNKKNYKGNDDNAFIVNFS